MNIKTPRGTKDIYGNEVYLWQYTEEAIRKICRDFLVTEIRTPIFEHTELFQRGVGETTDIVQKEMYTFDDKKGRSLTLKPEGTACVARSFIENKMYADVQPTKLYYITPVFRYEKPQEGRMRQFHQFGVEMFGSYNSSCDTEVISIVWELFERLGLKNIELKINSLGCSECRKKYNEELKKYIGDNLESFCHDCQERFIKNPLRILDCKNEKCKNLISEAPSILDCLDDECKKHFEEVKENLTKMNIPFIVDDKIVRGLDYYTRTVFEFISNDEKYKGTVCGGGRYDNLIEQCGGPSTGAVGFAIGLERIMLILNEQIDLEEYKNVDIFVGSIGREGFLKSQSIVYELRKKGICAEYDTLERSVKAQLKYADKIKANFSVVIGDNEIESGIISIKNMNDGTKKEINISNIESEIMLYKKAKEK